jgi:hypothetical protein
VIALIVALLLLGYALFGVALVCILRARHAASLWLRERINHRTLDLPPAEIAGLHAARWDGD